MPEFLIGQKFRVRGAEIHHGHVVTIVSPVDELSKARKAGIQVAGGLTHRPGLVAAFNPLFPSTLWWWFAPHQLEATTSDKGDQTNAFQTREMDGGGP